MASRADSISLLTAGDDQGRQSAATLAATVDTTSEFGVQLRKVLDDLANGDDIVIVHRDREVSPAGAAELLGVSRQFVDRLLADGVLAFRRLPGSNHRRIQIADVLALSEDRERIRRGRMALGALLS
ncbi:MAG: excisionase family DNA-binding protein [Solirubrobacteraceae bacterium]